MRDPAHVSKRKTWIPAQGRDDAVSAFAFGIVEPWLFWYGSRYICLLCSFKLLPVSNGTSVELPDIPFCFSTSENTVMISYIFDLQIYIVALERFLLNVRVQKVHEVHLNPVFCVKSLRKRVLCKEKSFSLERSCSVVRSVVAGLYSGCLESEGGWEWVTKDMGERRLRMGGGAGTI